jgi:cysteine desulfurase
MFPPKLKKQRQIYLDNAAATPIDERVFAVMKPYLTTQFANPSGLSAQSLEVRQAIDNARQIIANTLSTQKDTIFFTSGGTESINAAILGVARSFTLSTKHFGHIITSKIEHDAVLEPIRSLEKQGWRVTYLKPNEQGIISKEKVKDALRKETVLVSIMYANNEIGTVEPIADIGREILKWRKERNTQYPYFHTDACQATAYLDMHVEKLHVDLLSINGSKIYGPKGIGALFVRRGVKIEPIIYGGGQESGLRSGTENVAGIVGFGRAIELINKEQKIINKKQAELIVCFWQEIKKNIPEAKLNGPDIFSNKDNNYSRLPNNLSVSFTDIEAESILFYLERYGVVASSGSACSSVRDEVSHVLLACGKTDVEAKSTVRFTIGKETTKNDIKFVVKYLSLILKELYLINNI